VRPRRLRHGRRLSDGTVVVISHDDDGRVTHAIRYDESMEHVLEELEGEAAQAADEKLVRRCPLLSREVEGRRAMRDRDDDAASGQHVGRVVGIARRGVQAEGVSMHTSAARNRVRSQKAQSLSGMSPFWRP
jgi:hypothetical protein